MFSKFIKFDWILVISVFLLLTMGLTSLYSISTSEKSEAINFFSKQLIFVAVGVVFMLIFYFIDYGNLKLYSTAIYFATLFFLLVVLLWGSVARGTSGWIGFGSLHIQPVEIAKLSLIIFLASFISQKKSQLEEKVRLISSFVLSVVMIFLVMRQPDVGSALILAGIWLGIMLVSGINKKHFFFLFFSGIALVLASWFFLADYQKTRIVNIIKPEIDPMGSGYNVIQSMVSVGSGGLTGKGMGHGSQSQLNFLPEKHTDFIFSAIAEEAGLAGSIFVLILYLTIFYRIKGVAEFSRDNFGYLLAAGIMIMFAIQIFINIGMNIGIVPVTGIPLPFLSYGGSSLVVSFISLGILLNIYNKKIR